MCGNSARRDLCGGRRVTDVPTATHSRIKSAKREFEYPADFLTVRILNAKTSKAMFCDSHRISLLEHLLNSFEQL